MNAFFRRFFVSSFSSKYVTKYICDTRVNEWYMIESMSRLNESDSKDMITKKNLKKLNVTIYTNKVYIHFLVAR